MAKLSDHKTWGNLKNKTLANAPQSAQQGKNIFQLDDLVLDQTHALISDDTWNDLFSLVDAQNIVEWQQKYFNGDHINTSEDRAVLHWLARQSIEPNQEHLKPIWQDLQTQWQKLENLSSKIRNSNVKTIIQIAVGGPYFGPKCIVDSLATSYPSNVKVKFIATPDKTSIANDLRDCDPKTTIAILASKSFSTSETQFIATEISNWFQSAGCNMADQMIAVTANPSKAEQDGYKPDHILTQPETIGGRFNSWSAQSAIIAFAYGMDVLKDVLRGGEIIDQHMQSVTPENNLPLRMALSGLFYRTIVDLPAYGLYPYHADLHALPAYVQQVDMESNGKHVTRDNTNIDYQTSPIFFGLNGTNCQHSFFQAVHQGTTPIPGDFIVALPTDSDDQHMIINTLAQTQAMAKGDPGNGYPGGRPSQTIFIKSLTPKTLGMLMALYEAKVIYQGFLWGLNSFDQPGVQLGKVLAQTLNGIKLDSKESLAKIVENLRLS